MSYIQFESAREKEKIRQDLREAREQMLEKAKLNAERRLERETQKTLSGEANWMLPKISSKIDKLSQDAKTSTKKSKKKKDNKKKSKKKKSSNKKRKKHSSSNEYGSDTESDDAGRSRSKRKTKKKKNKDESSSTSSDSEEEESNEWVERLPSKPDETLQRDSWMTDTLMLKTFSRERIEKKPNDKQTHETYDPTKSARELNPYWKATGTGMPAFQKPKDDSDDERRFQAKPTKSNQMSRAGNWRKNINDKLSATNTQKRRGTPTPSSTSSSSESEHTNNEKVDTGISNFLTDQQMNELGAKILKAEIMGNTALAEELKKKLESARSNRASVKERRTTMSNKSNVTRSKHGENDNVEEEHVLLTRTDERGNCRPLAQTKYVADPRDLYGGRNARKKQKRIETHVDGERVRYFPDDDKYDIKQMFEREKYTTAAEANLQFAEIAGKHKNPRDDLEDIFADKVRKNLSKEETDQKELQQAIREHNKLSVQLENCDRCFDSVKMDKKLLVALGEKVYLTLPWFVGLQSGHCIIVPSQHVTCVTQLDEDTWEEVNNFRKALTRVFAAQHKDVIFYEIANRLHRRPHLAIHCIPIPESKGEMAPFYFKKAIEESEREWSVNKQLVSLRDKSLRSSIPKGLPYFWVNFGMDRGFAHVIEDQDRFPSNFAQEIIGGMLQLDPKKWRKPQKEQNIIARVKIFAEWWKKYDCTERN